MSLSIDADAWLAAEILNPWGPARERILYTLVPVGEGFEATVVSPAGWETSDLVGTAGQWTFALTGEPGSREMSWTVDGEVQTFTEGELSAPGNGLTAVARAFESGGQVDEAFCNSGSLGFDYNVLFDFARNGGDEQVAIEVVAGAPVEGWFPVGGAFALADLGGFERDGGTPVEAPVNWVVHYQGTLTHPGGDLSVRERDDSVEDGVWVWLGAGVGGNTSEWFLEVHGFVWFDGTSDEPSASFAAGDLPIEVIAIRCDVAIENVELELSVGGGPWTSAALAPANSDTSEDLFPTTF